MSERSLVERVVALERQSHGEVDTSGLSPEEIAAGRAKGTIPFVAQPNALAQNMTLLAAHQEAWNAAPLTPGEALTRYLKVGERPNLVFLPQFVRLTHSGDHRRCDFPRGWHLVAPCFGVLSTGYMGAEQVPRELLEAWAGWNAPPPAAA